MGQGMRRATRPTLVIGHRGFAARFPDNSLAGVLAALAAGADGVEVDVRPSADGSWVCHHDRARAGRPVREWRDGELAREGVPSLAAVAAAVPADRCLVVEVKPLPENELQAGAQALAGILDPRLVATRVISSSPVVLRTVGQALPGVALSLVCDSLPERLPEGVTLSPFHRLVEALLPLGVALHPWTVNRPGRMRELARLGVASITTNDPPVALEVLGG